MNNIGRRIKRLDGVVVLCFGLVITIVILGSGINIAKAEWIEPDMAPTLEQFDAPLTTGYENQAKRGYLELDPVYNPSSKSSLIFGSEKPLRVKGGGVHFSTPNTYSDILTVDTDTLYAHFWHDWVGIGTTSITEGYRLKIVDGTVQVGTSGQPINGRAVSGFSGDKAGIYSEVDDTGTAGIYSSRLAADGLALRGDSANNVGIKGESYQGYGIYATTESYSNAAVYGENSDIGWAGYFDGRLFIGSELVTQQFLPSALQMSLIPYTSAVKAGTYQVSDGIVSGGVGGVTFDGSHIWVADTLGESAGGGHKLWRVRASDGEVTDAFDVTGTPQALAFDGGNIWSGEYASDNVIKIDHNDGTILADCSTRPTPADPLNYWGDSDDISITTSTIDGEVFIWTANQFGADLTKFDRDCNQIGVYPVGTTGGNEYKDRLNDQGWRLRVDDAMFADGYIWTLTPNICKELGTTATTLPFININKIGICIDDGDCVAGDGYDGCVLNDTQLVKMDPATGAVVGRYDTGLLTPGSLVFDGVHIWIISSVDQPENKVAKVRASDGQLIAVFDQDKDGVLFSKMTDLVFDGTYVWISGDMTAVPDDLSLYRIAAYTSDPADPDIVKFPGRLMGTDGLGELAFDGSYIWHMSQCKFVGGVECGTTGCGGGNCPLSLTKHFTGTGYGNADLGTVVNLRKRVGQCSVSAVECVYDRHCPATETCSTAFENQAGNMNITDDVQISISHCYEVATDEHHYSEACTQSQDCIDVHGLGWSCVGGDVTVGSDVMAENNQWAGSDETVSVAGGTAECSSGKYIKGVTIDAGGLASEIVCRGL